MNIYRIHHIVPRHAGGTDDPSNLVRLTIEEHGGGKIMSPGKRYLDKPSTVKLLMKLQD